jgi:hypothetical protein
MKYVRFSSHAHKRMKERRISRTSVLSVIARPQTKRASIRNRWIARKIIAGRPVEVIYTIERDALIIVTLYIL